MANTININIKNCCCGGGTAASAGGSEIVPITELPDPTGIEGPPEGFGPPSSITDRQCKAAVFMYEWVYWWLDTALNNPVGEFLVNLIVSDMPFVAKAALMYALIPVISSALGSLGTWGIDIADAAIAPISGILGLILAHSLVNLIGTYSFTLPVIEDIFTKLPTYRDQIICYMSQAENQSELYGQLENAFKDTGFSDGQIALIFAVMPPAVIGLFYWSADWWPSFETETLASITETCCGDIEPGLPLPPGTVNKCDATNFVLDQLIQLLNNIGEFTNNWFTYNLFGIILDLESEVYDSLKQDLTVPRKAKEAAFYLDQFYRYLAKYLADKGVSWDFSQGFINGDEFDTFAQFLSDNDDLIVCQLYIASDTEAAYSILESYIDAYLDTTELTANQKSLLKVALDGIIYPPGEFLNLLFTQDSDLVGYTGIVDCSTCSGEPGSCTFLTGDLEMGTVTNVQVNGSVTSVYISSEYGHMGFNPDSHMFRHRVPAECGDHQLTNLTLTGWTDNGYSQSKLSNGYYDYDGAGGVAGHAYSDPYDLIGAIIGPGGFVQITSGTEFTAVLEYTEVV